MINLTGVVCLSNETSDGGQVLRWNVSNIACETDKAGKKSFHKGKSRDRIDGAQAMAMSVGRASTGDSSRSIYEGDDRADGLNACDVSAERRGVRKWVLERQTEAVLQVSDRPAVDKIEPPPV